VTYSFLPLLDLYKFERINKRIAVALYLNLRGVEVMSGDNDLDSEHYYSLKEAADNVSDAFGAKETAVASAKLVGKTVFNTALFGGKLGLKVLKEAPAIMQKVAEQAAKEVAKKQEGK
jgi:hypothetical protein